MSVNANLPIRPDPATAGLAADRSWDGRSLAREFLSVWHWADLSRGWVVAIAWAVATPLVAISQVPRNEPGASGLVILCIPLTPFCIAMMFWALTRRLADRKAARAELAAPPFDEMVQELSLQVPTGADCVRLRSGVPQLGKPFGVIPTSVLGAFRQGTGVHAVTLFLIETRRGSVRHRIVATTQLDSSHPAATMQHMRGRAKKAEVPDLYTRGAAEELPVALRRWVAQQTSGLCVIVEDNRAVCTSDGYLTAVNIAPMFRALTHVADVLNQASGQDGRLSAATASGIDE